MQPRNKQEKHFSSFGVLLLGETLGGRQDHSAQMKKKTFKLMSRISESGKATRERQFRDPLSRAEGELREGDICCGA